MSSWKAASYSDPRSTSTKQLRGRKNPYVYDVEHNALMSKPGVRGGARKFKYGPGLMGNYLSHSGDHIVRLRNKTRRAPRRFGTRVRRQALKLSESKRYISSLTTTASLANTTIFRYAIFRELRNPTNPGSGASEGLQINQDNRIKGKTAFIRGARVDIRVTNLSTTNPTDVRIFCGWMKGNQVRPSDTLKSNDAIFRDKRDDEGSRRLTETSAVGRGVLWRAIYIPFDKKVFHCEKEFHLRLGPAQSTEDHAGDDFKILKFWWEMNNKRLDLNTTVLPTGTDTDMEKACSFYPCVYVYHSPPTVGGTGSIYYDITSELYYRDP